MIRFGTKSLLIGFAVVALWLSTFAGYAAARDVRASILLLIFVVSGLAAMCSRGAQRTFWVGFFAVMLLCGGNDFQRPLNRYVPNFAWLSASSYSLPTPFIAPSPVIPQQRTSITTRLGTTGLGPGFAIDTPVTPPIQPFLVPATPTANPIQRDAVEATVAAAWTLALATLAGFVGAFIYKQHAGDHPSG